MNIEKIAEGQVTVHIPLREAGDLLRALRDLRDELDDEAHALEVALEKAGVSLPDPEDHRRYEYMPPADRKTDPREGD
ncbi:hypothetical protein B1C78_10610 [Thioalkalivibrio denitrificans]|uniref:Uncharacterized protein n=1 Tax=Thioalkalivibrio denitrificans TaxID=108003 RepID=A0A1V3NFC1_9GAMM|nr:hypothetical protein [Thioalkalivibrio denitrificans]OOG23725.1 hypothetical protein B1C78_10610 [Thioalkalivibrio denitrificans]